MYYCDANGIAGTFCPEFDIMEANQYSFLSTAHKCDAPEKGYYAKCDAPGSNKANVHHQEENSYGPGPENKINTLRKFHVKVEFHEEDNQLSSYTVTLSQDGKTLELTSSAEDDAKLLEMTPDFKSGMAFVVSNWSDKSEELNTWLQGDKCSGECDKPTLNFSNLQFNTV